MPGRQHHFVAVIAGLVAASVACGGGGSDESASDTSTSTTAPATSTTTAPGPAFTLTAVDAGDAACYLTLTDRAGAEATEFADFELCPGGSADVTRYIGSQVTLERRPGQVMADSCAGDPYCTDTKTVQLVVAVKPVSTPGGASPSSSGLVGQTDTDPAHWAPSGHEQPLRIQQRIFGADPPTLVGDFPVTMNGCNLRQLRVKWRSVDSPVAAGIADYTDPTTPPAEIRQQQPPATQGTMTLGGCEQPDFRTYPQPSGSNLANVVVEVTVYEPAA